MKTYLWTLVVFNVLETLKKKKGVLETKEGQADDLGQAGEKGVVFVDLQKNKTWNVICLQISKSFILYIFLPTESTAYQRRHRRY